MDPQPFMDRELQREMLEEMRNAYPRHVDYQHLSREGNQEKIKALAYLAGHRLVEVSWSQAISKRGPTPVWATITVRGLDFIADDGGLSAILGTVTVRLHEDTLKHLLLSAVEKAEVTPAERSALQQAIRNLPAKASGKLLDKLLDLGVEHLPTAGSKLYTWLSQAGIHLPL